jgi:2-methylcitrate dehydratase PrpD
VSAQHSVAVALLVGAAGLPEYSDQAVNNPGTLAMRSKVRMADDPSMSIEAAEIIITFVDGRTVAKRVEQARGGTLHPLSDADLETKLRELAKFGGSGCQPQPLIDAIWSLDSRPDAGQLMALAADR